MKKTLLLITGLLAAPHASLGSGLSPCLGQKSRPDPVVADPVGDPVGVAVGVAVGVILSAT